MVVVMRAAIVLHVSVSVAHHVQTQETSRLDRQIDHDMLDETRGMHLLFVGIASIDIAHAVAVGQGRGGIAIQGKVRENDLETIMVIEDQAMDTNVIKVVGIITERPLTKTISIEESLNTDEIVQSDLIICT